MNKQQEIKLRYYQNDSISATFDYINKGGKAGIAVLPTGTGKSIIVGSIVEKILKKKPHVRAMMLTHSKELIEQNHDKLKSLWPTAPAGIYSAGIGFKQFQYPIIYGGVQSCYRKPELFGHIDILIIDECHLVSEKTESMYGAMINGLRMVNPNLVVIGFTATPFRLGMGYLTEGPIFDDIFYDISTMDNFVRLIDEGYLCDLIPVATDTQYDLSTVKMNGGEFQEKSLDENINRDAITREVVLETIRRTSGRNKGIAFCVSKSHAENMARRFTEAGYSSEFIHSDLSKSEREDVLKRYADNKFNVICNVGVLTTGFDAPDIDFMVLSRPTESTSLHIQMLGRGMRPHSSKDNTLVLDFAGNCMRLGPVNDPVIPVKKGEERGEAPCKLCEVCGVINHAAAKICISCGAEFPEAKVRINRTPDHNIDIIRRRDIPKIENFDVEDVIVTKHTSQKGNLTVKLSFVTEDKNIYDTYLTFDRKMGKGYRESVNKLGKLRFKNESDTPKDNIEAIEYFKENLVAPKQVRVWLNKPVPGVKTRRKDIIDFIY